ncbi:MAG: hypothetical protein K8S56_08650 [Candidatus Cloacimonetes bacterium]|nr:hypothetical protein [Candidatus Cloacimonadota bacterium]
MLHITKRITLLLFILSIMLPLQAIYYDAVNNLIVADNIGFRPQFQIGYTKSDGQGSVSEINFKDVQQLRDGMLSMIQSVSDYTLTFTATPYSLLENAWLMNIRIDWKNNVDMKTNKVRLSFADFVQYYKGPDAIHSQDNTKNLQIVPYRCKVIEYHQNGNQFWVIGSHYKDCRNIELMEFDAVISYDSKFHDVYWPNGSQYSGLCPRQAGSDNEYSFIVSETKPAFPLINYYPAGKRAALTISSNADGENTPRLRAIFFGTSDINSPEYGQNGLVGNQLRITNSIFGYHYADYAEVYQEIMDTGNIIACNTYHPFEDDIELLAQNLIYDTQHLNIRTWIDHLISNNPENLVAYGWAPGSPHYILDILETAGIDYAWLCESKDYSFNAFEDYSQLPHRAYALTGNYPLMIFRRKTAVYWDHIDGLKTNDWTSQIVPENLNTLLENRGLVNVYSHLVMGNWPEVIPFSYYDAQGYCQIKDDVEENFEMLNDYQQNKGLWVAPMEEVYDRLIATDKLVIEPVTGSNDIVAFTLHNPTDYDLDNFALEWHGEEYQYNTLYAGETRLIELPINGTLRTIGSASTSISLAYTIQRDGSHFLFSLKDSEALLSKIDVFNVKGQKILSDCLPDSDQTAIIDMQTLPVGIYLFRAKLKNHSRDLVFKKLYLK